MQPRLFLLMYMSQTFVKKHNYDERGTFKIDHIFVFGSNTFLMGVHGTLLWWHQKSRHNMKLCS